MRGREGFGPICPSGVGQFLGDFGPISEYSSHATFFSLSFFFEPHFLAYLSDVGWIGHAMSNSVTAGVDIQYTPPVIGSFFSFFEKLVRLFVTW